MEREFRDGDDLAVVLQRNQTTVITLFSANGAHVGREYSNRKQLSAYGAVDILSLPVRHSRNLTIVP
jgi:hypothetical protein